MKKIRTVAFLIVTAISAAACAPSSAPPPAKQTQALNITRFIQDVTGDVDDAALRNADDRPGDWLSYGRNYAEDRYSSLVEITPKNVADLGLAWTIELTSNRGIQATPLVVDGVMFFTGPWSVVYAVDARKGEIIWRFDPDVPREKAPDFCCGVVSRGLALYKGAVLLATLDGRLMSLDAGTGEPLWSVKTVPEGSNYSITGAPRVANGKVLIGNGGAEYAGIRGYVTAYDANTGNQIWRFYTVPAGPDGPFESPELEMAAGTWTGIRWSKGGGGTAWDAIVFDPEFNSVYIGVGNGSHWDRNIRSPEGGDNLFLSSIVAVDADTGAYKWHYQTTPGDSWDYTATQPIILADLEIDGASRKVLMQAPKNGFFYVIDRSNGELISAEPYTYVNWASHIDENGRPVEKPGARYTDGKTHWLAPGSHGGHNWFPMSYNHETGLVYIPGVLMSGPYADNKNLPNLVDEATVGNEFAVSMAVQMFNEQVIDPDAPPPGPGTGELIAYDPVKQERVWAIPHKHYYNGGLLSTKSGLLMQGDAEGHFSIRSADSGELLRQFDLKAGIISSPVTYEVDGEQYITIIAEWGGSHGQSFRISDAHYNGTVYTFKLGGNTPPPAPKTKFAGRRELSKLTTDASPLDLGWGLTHYFWNCVGCHGVPGADGGALPNLARSSEATFDSYDAIILEGAYAALGMPVHKHLSVDDVKQLKAYVIFMAQSLRQGQTMADINKKLAEYQKLAWDEGRSNDSGPGRSK